MSMNISLGVSLSIRSSFNDNLLTERAEPPGRGICWLRMRHQDPKACGPRDFARMVASVVLNSLTDPDIARCGIVMLNEMTGVGLKNMNPSIPKYLFGSIFPRLPVRVGRFVLPLKESYNASKRALLQH